MLLQAKFASRCQATDTLFADDKGLATPPSYMTSPRGGHVNDCSCLMFIDKHNQDDRNARNSATAKSRQFRVSVTFPL
jgi:hypothetical protein